MKRGLLSCSAAERGLYRFGRFRYSFFGGLKNKITGASSFPLAIICFVYLGRYYTGKYFNKLWAFSCVANSFWGLKKGSLTFIPKNPPFQKNINKSLVCFPRLLLMVVLRDFSGYINSDCT